MSIPVSCGHCKKRFAAPDHFANRSINCPACRTPMMVGPPPVTEELLPLSAFNAEELPAEPFPAYSNPAFQRPFAAPQFSGGAGESRGIFANVSTFRATNLKFIAGVVFTTLIALGTYGAFLPRSVALYLSGAAVVHATIIILFLAILPRQERSQFDWLYKVAAFLPAGLLCAYLAVCLTMLIWEDLMGNQGIPVVEVGYGAIVFAVGIAILSLIGAIYLFCYRKFGFWRSHAVSHIVGLISILGYVPFVADQINQVQERKLAQEERARIEREESKRESQEFREQMDREAKEREVKDAERAKLALEESKAQQATWKREQEERERQSKERQVQQETEYRQDYFKRKIESALESGKNREGRDLLYADMISSHNDDLDLQLKVCTPLKRPVINVHWVMGVETTPLADEENATAAAPGQTIGTPFVPSMGVRGQEEIAKDFAQRAGAAGVLIGQTLSSRSLEGRFGPWGGVSRYGFNRDKPRGVSLVPPGSTDSIVSSARGMGADVLIAANVQVRPSSSNTPDATLILRILELASGKELWRSEKLTTGRMLAARRKGLRDPGLDLAEAALQKIEQDFMLKPVPELKPEVAQKRAAKIASAPIHGKLAALAELRYYENQGWLTPAQALEHYTQLLGPQSAIALTSERLKDRQEVVEKLVVEQPY